MDTHLIWTPQTKISIFRSLRHVKRMSLWYTACENLRCTPQPLEI